MLHPHIPPHTKEPLSVMTGYRKVSQNDDDFHRMIHSLPLMLSSIWLRIITHCEFFSFLFFSDLARFHFHEERTRVKQPIEKRHARFRPSCNIPCFQHDISDN